MPSPSVRLLMPMRGLPVTGGRIGLGMQLENNGLDLWFGGGRREDGEYTGEGFDGCKGLETDV